MRLVKAVESTWDSAEDVIAQLDAASQLVVHVGQSLLGVYWGLQGVQDVAPTERVLQLERQVVAAELALAQLGTQTEGARASLLQLLGSLAYPWLRHGYEATPALVEQASTVAAEVG